MSKTGKIAVIDGNSLLFRAFFAIKTPMITSEGLYTHAIYGFLNMLSKVMDDLKPDYIAVAFDRKAPTFRHEEYDAYKAGRAKTPDELHMQMPYLKDVLTAMNITILEMDGFEADDLIGTVAKEAEIEGLEVLVITGDRDELQLVTDKVSVLVTKKGVSEFEVNTPDSMLEKYGFGPELFVDYKGLMGDASDNIPGLPGVGEKTAAKLILQFGSIEDIVARVAEVEPERIRNIIIENEQTAFMSKRLATIVTNAPIEVDFDAMLVRDWDIAQLRKIYTELEFRSLLKKLDNKIGTSKTDSSNTNAEMLDELLGVNDYAVGASNTSMGETPKTDMFNTPKAQSIDKVVIELDFDSVDISMIEAVDGLDAVRAAIEKNNEIVFHTLGSSDHVEDPLVYAIYIYVNNQYFCIWTRTEEELLLETCKMIATLPLKLTGFGLKDDIFRIRRILEVNDETNLSKSFIENAYFDIGVANYLLAPGGSEPTFAQIAEKYGGITLNEEPDFTKDILAFDKEYIANFGKDFCVATEALVPELARLLEADNAMKLFSDIEMPLVDTLAEIELNGFTYDSAAMDEIASSINTRIEELTASITELAEGPFNINSPKQLGEILFERLGLKGGKKNKNGYSTSADILAKLKDDHPIIEQVLEYRMLVKLRGTYIEGLPTFVSNDGKIRAHLMQTVAATGRLSCVDPNLQNIPIRKEPGRQLRRAFVPESEEYILIGADYSQIELRILAHLSSDPSLIEDFLSGADIHSRTAARVFGLSNDDEVTIEQRSGAKAVNFGIIYGMSSFGLSEELSISRKDAEHYIAEYFKKHQAVKQFMDDCVKTAKAQGYTTTIFDRRRPIPEIMSSQYMVRQMGERLAMNSPVQGSAADIIKIAMNRVCSALRKEGLESTLILQVHDELILQVKKGEEEVATQILKNEMERAAELKVPLVVDVKVAKSWYELK